MQSNNSIEPMQLLPGYIEIMEMQKVLYAHPLYSAMKD